MWHTSVTRGGGIILVVGDEGISDTFIAGYGYLEGQCKVSWVDSQLYKGASRLRSPLIGLIRT